MADHQEILAQLASTDVATIREGAFAAGQAKCQEAIPLLVRHLEKGNVGVQEAAVAALRAIGGSETVRAAIPLLRSEEAPVRNLSMELLREVGAQELESLTGLMEDQDPDIRIFASDILGSSGSVMAVKPLCKALRKDPEVNVRYQAAVSLGELGRPEAAKCLNEALDDEEWVQFSVIEALVKIRDESSVNALLKAMDSSSDLVQSMIVDALSEMGNVKAVSMLFKRMDESSTALRNKIVKAVVTILGGKSLTLLTENERAKLKDYLLVALQDEDLDIQQAAMTGLCHVGGERATTEVLKLAGKLDPDRDREYLERITECLADIGPNDSLEAVIRDGAWKPAVIAVRSVALMGKTNMPPVIQEVFDQKDLDLQRVCVETLAKVGGKEEEPFFLHLLDTHEDGEVLKTAIAFLGRQHSVEAGERILAMLSHPFDDVKEAALDAAVAIGGPDIAARFREMFTHDDPMERFLATHALGRMGVEDNREILEKALSDEVPDIRKAAVESLSDVCVDETYLPLLERCLDDEYAEVRLTVVELLGKCSGEDSVVHLERALDDEDDWVKVRALEALAERGVKRVAPKIVPLLHSENKLVVLKTVEALGGLGGQTAFRALLEMLGSDDPEVEAAVAEAMNRLKSGKGGE